MGGEFGPRLLDDGLGVLLGEVLEFAVALQGFLNRVGLITGDMTGDILAIFPGLQLVVGPLRAFGHNAQFAPFHALNLSDLLEELAGLGWVHGGNIYYYRYSVTKKLSNKSIFQIFVSRPIT